MNLRTYEILHPEDSAETSSKLYAEVLTSKNISAKTKAFSKDKPITFHDGNNLLTEKNTQDGFLNMHRPINEEIWVLCAGG